MRFIRASLLFLGIFAIGYIAMGSFEQYTIQEGLGLEAGDIAQFATSDLENLTIYIAPAAQMSAMGASNPNTGKTFTLSHARVTTATSPYSRTAFAQDHPENPSLHYLTTPQIQEVANYRITMQTQGKPFSLLSVAATPNDTAEAVGENFVKSEKIAISDFKASKKEFSVNASAYTTWGRIDPRYAKYSPYLLSNGTDTDFSMDPPTKRKDQEIHVSTIDNFEDDTLAVLKSNIAANYSTASDIITPDRVSILDYAYDETRVNSTILDIYLTSKFSEKIRNALDESEEKEAQYQLVIFGIKVYQGPTKVKAGLFDGVGKVFSLGKGIISDPIGTAGNLKDTTINTGVNLGKGLINSACSIPSTLTKSGGKAINTFTSTTGLGANLGESLGKAGKLATNGFSTLVSGAKGILSAASPFLFFGLIILAAGGAIYLLVFMPRRAPKEYEPVPRG